MVGQMTKRNCITGYRAILGAILLIATASSDVNAQSAYTTDSGHVEFRSSVPLHSFTGKSDKLTGRISLADSTVDFFVDLTTLKTGNGKRDRDMRKTLNTDDFPFAEFFGKLVTPFTADSGGVQNATVKGQFKVHGISKPLDVEGTLQKDGDQLLLEAQWSLSLADYEIVPPKLLIMKVDDEQRIRINVALKEEIN